MRPPTYGHDSLAAVLPAAAGALGVDFTTATGLASLGCAAAFGLPSVDCIVVVMCDGLGWVNLTERCGHASFLRGRLAQARVLDTCFPTTTAAALATFGTGTCPGLTGLLGYTQRNPVTHGLANPISWREQGDPRRAAEHGFGEGAVELPVLPERLQREPTVFERLIADGVGVTTVGLRRFDNSGLSRAALRGGEFVGVEQASEVFDAALDVLDRRLGGPRLIYVYWGALDKIGHKHGWTSWQWGAALEEFDQEVARLCAAHRASLVLLTADHGQIEVDRQIDVAAIPELSSQVALVGGEPRALHLYLDSDSGSELDAESVATRWRRTLAQRLARNR